MEEMSVCGVRCETLCGVRHCVVCVMCEGKGHLYGVWCEREDACVE